jgi:hypothetical protein
VRELARKTRRLAWRLRKLEAALAAAKWSGDVEAVWAARLALMQCRWPKR